MPDAGDVTPAVTTAFAFGWQMARFYTGPLSSAAEPRLQEDLPGLSELPAAQLVKLGLAQADVALSRLKAFLKNSPLPATDALRSETERSPADRDAIRKAILDLHVAVLVQLTAADYRLGKAYGLGRALADTCAPAHGDETERRRALAHHLEPHRASVIVAWLEDLKTVLPAHAGHGVADSLQRWERWAEATGLATAEPAAVSKFTNVLHRCGQRWRAILSGEKAATDLLEIGDYVSAARGALARAAAVARELAMRLWAALAAAAVLMAIGIWLIIANHSTAQVLAGLGTVAGGLGITWRGAAGLLKRLSFDLVRTLWEAQIDAEVATRLTPLPQRDYVPEPQRPDGRWRRAWHELRAADPRPARGTPAKPDPGTTDSPPSDTGGEEAANTPVLEIEPSPSGRGGNESDI